MKPPYRTDQNIWLTSSLFHEVTSRRMHDQRSGEAVFSLYEDIPGLINARKTFIALGDPTGYQWAVTYLDSWQHFQKLMKAPWFRTAFTHWNEELTAKRKSEALAKIREIAMEEGNKSALPAARYLAELDKRSSARGRPTKVEMDAELRKQVNVLEIEDEDMERMGLKVITGGKN
jgi:hypothetical protein